MKINWNQNPLLTTVDVDERDRNVILTYLQSEALMDLFCEIDYLINKDAIGFEDTKKIMQKWIPIADMETTDEIGRAHV